MSENAPKKKLFEKNWFRAVVFVIIAGLLFVYLNQVFTMSKSDASKQIFDGFYSEKEESLDVVYMGTSATNRYFITPKAFHDEGVAVYNLAVMGLPVFFMPNLIDEIEKSQDPQLYVIELRGVLRSKNDVTDAHIRRVTDSMKTSENKKDAVQRALEYTEGASGELGPIDEGGLAYYVPIVKYHSRLATGDMKLADFSPVSTQWHTKGYVLSPNTLNIVKQKPAVEWTDETAPLAPEMEEALADVLDKCEELGKEIVFVLAPYSVKAGQPEMFNSAIKMVEDRGYEVLNFNLKEETDAMGIDWKKDFYNSKHVNYVGAEKYTDYLLSYLKERYELPDHRGDEEYASWEEAYQKYLDYIEPGLREVEVESDL